MVASGCSTLIFFSKKASGWRKLDILDVSQSGVSPHHPNVPLALNLIPTLHWNKIYYRLRNDLFFLISGFITGSGLKFEPVFFEKICSANWIISGQYLFRPFWVLHCLLGLTNRRERSLKTLPPASFPEVSGEQNKQIFEVAPLKICFSELRLFTLKTARNGENCRTSTQETKNPRNPKKPMEVSKVPVSWIVLQKRILRVFGKKWSDSSREHFIPSLEITFSNL